MPSRTRSKLASRNSGSSSFPSSRVCSLPGLYLLIPPAQFVIDFEHLGIGNLLAPDQRGIARIGNFDLAQHLPHDDFDVFVIDAHALQAVNVLHLVDEVLRQHFHSFQPQNVVRGGRAFGDNFTSVDVFPFKHRHVAPFRNQGLVRLGGGAFNALHRSDDQPALALGFLAETDSAGNFRQDGRFLRLARFEQVRYPRQTAGDVHEFSTLPGAPWQSRRRYAVLRHRAYL